ncbi:MAG: hypothetical protein QG635_1679, partial [Bacteroidota bacterium]|nr:hypothetical protein [Bacteroidota bacterium]
MKNLFILVIAIIIPALIFNSCECKKKGLSPEQVKTIKAEILALLSEAKTAAEKLDAVAAFANLSDDSSSVFIFSGRTYNARQTVELLTKSYSLRESQKLDLSLDNIKVISPDAALWTGGGKGEILLKDGKSMTAYLQETWFWQKIQGKWKVTHLHESAAIPPNAEEKAV